MSKRKLDYRRIEPREPAPTRAWFQRRAVLFAGVVVFVFSLFLCAGPSWAIVLIKLFTDGLLVIAWLTAAGGYGSLVAVPRIQNESDETSLVPTVVTRVALGMGIISLLQLGLGLAGFIGRASALIVIASGLIFAAARVFTRRIDLAKLRDWLLAPASYDWLWLLAPPPLALAIVAALVPPGVLWGDEPHGYDVVEYHLQLAREWYQLGRIVPLHHNVFSYFPLGTEMHYLLAMQLRGGPWAGMYLAQLMHVAMCALAVVAVYAAGRALGSRVGATLVAVFVATTPWFALLAPVAYNEGGLLLFGTLCIFWAIHAVRSEKAIGSWGLAGTFAGFACGVKLTAAPMLLVAVPFVAIAVSIIQRKAVARVALGCAVFAAVCVALFSPWLIRNVAWAHNPVFPEGQHLFGRAHFSPVQSERWHLAHSPPPPQRTVRARLVAAADQIVFDWRFGYALLPLAAAALALSWRRTESWMLAGMIGLLLIFWLFFTHLQGRFFVLAIPLGGLLIAQVRQRWAIQIFAALVVVQFALAARYLGEKFLDRVGPFRDNQILAIEDLKSFLPQEVEDIITHRPDATLALVGDARAFLYQIPTSRLRYRTVFDVDTPAEGKTIIDAWLGEQTGTPFVVIDPFELQRFSKTYYGIPPLPDDFPAPRDRVFVLTPHR